MIIGKSKWQRMPDSGVVGLTIDFLDAPQGCTSWRVVWRTGIGAVRYARVEYLK